MTLPILLAGPILRRTEPGRVCIWLATSRPADVQARIFAPVGAEASRTVSRDDLSPIGVSAPRGERPETVQLGERLFVSLLCVKPSAGEFPLDSLLFYDVVLNGKSLSELDLIGGESGITYPDMPLPCFFISDGMTHFLHGSCRKPHGLHLDSGSPGGPLEEERDALAVADEEVEKVVVDLENRPAALFLTGDQIYADDVAGPLLRLLSSYGEELTGWKEQMPAMARNPADIGLYGRTRALSDAGSGFTSKASENHLLTFGEFAAMYVLVWNDDLWPDDMPEPGTRLSAQQRARYEKEWTTLTRFKSSIRGVRRILANVPTYMIFDDHEITDDWNLHRQWHNRVRSGPAGRRVVSNGLAAYWAFQAWGNSPEAFSPRFINTMAEHLLRKTGEGPRAEAFDQRLWSFHRWAYALPTEPPVVVLDSRTQREFDSDTGPARLIDRYGADWVRTAWSELGAPKDRAPQDRAPQDRAPQDRVPQDRVPQDRVPQDHGVIIVAGTPVYGFEPLERMQKVISSFGLPHKVDRESWIANRKGFAALLRGLNREIRPGPCVIISGDVHYAFSTRARFHCDGRTLSMTQLTSSAINNKPETSKYVKWLGQLADRREYHFGWLPNAPRLLRLTRPLLELLVRSGRMRSDRQRKYFWTSEVVGVCPQGESSLLYPGTNIGLVHLRENGSVEHCLLTGLAGKSRLTFFV